MSNGLMLAALTLTRTSLLPTLGSGTSAARTSFLPYRATTNAFMWSFLSSELGLIPANGKVHQHHRVG